VLSRFLNNSKRGLSHRTAFTNRCSSPPNHPLPRYPTIASTSKSGSRNAPWVELSKYNLLLLSSQLSGIGACGAGAVKAVLSRECGFPGARVCRRQICHFRIKIRTPHIFQTPWPLWALQ